MTVLTRFSPKEIIAAAPDGIALATGLKNTSPHPLAYDIAERPLSAIAYAAGLQERPQQSYENDRTVMARGMATSDFGRAVSTAMQVAVEAPFNDAAGHRAFCSELEVRDFKPVTVVDTGQIPDMNRVDETAEITSGTAWAIDINRDVKLDSYGAALHFSREIVVNDDIGVVSRAVKAAGAKAARLEAALVYGTLVAYSEMASGEPFWLENFNDIAAITSLTNSIVSGPNDVLYLAPDISPMWFMQAIETLRRQKVNEQRFDLNGRYLLVSSGLEYAARKAVRDGGFDIRVIASGHVDGLKSYLFADPDLCPAIATLKLRGSKSPVRVEFKKVFSTDGFCLRIVADLGAALVSNGVGVVRTNIPTGAA